MGAHGELVAAIIPAYNEEQTIGGVVGALKASPLVDKIVVISDGSTDATAARAREAGAHLVHEFPWRHGKGAALQHGVTHTDAPIILFMDADLKGINQEHIAELIEPVLSGTRVMNVGLRDRGPFWIALSSMLPLIGGERALRRAVIEAIPDYYLRGWKIESALNYFCRVNGLPYGYRVMKGVSIRRKIDKFGLWVGLREYAHMFWQVAKAMIEVRMARACFVNQTAAHACARK